MTDEKNKPKIHVTAEGDRSVAIGGDVIGSIINTGNQYYELYGAIPIRVFISCPEDLSTERMVVEETIDVLNRYSRYHFVIYSNETRIETRFENASQSMIDNYFLQPEKADIFLCMMWQSMGWPTGLVDPNTSHPYQSIVEYEFLTAYRASTRNSQWPRILLYHCDRPIEKPTDEATRVTDFLANFEVTGKFSDRAGLASILTQQLEALLQEKQFERRLIANLIIGSKVRKHIDFLPTNLLELYIDRPTAMDILRKALLGDQSKIGLTAAVHGMGGLGKTVLARAICNDPVIKGAFPDGILWATVGQNTKPNEMHPRLSEIQKQWITVLGGDASAASNETLGKVELQALLEERAMLLVLDDVWHHSDIEYLKVAGRRCRILITTRDKAVADTRALIELGVMSVEESRELLKTASGGKLKDDELADVITERLGHLPLAMDIVARMLANDLKWNVIEKVLHSKFKQMKQGDETLAVVATSVSFLESEKQQRYWELIVFPQDEKIVEGAAAKLWKHVGLDLLDASLLLAEFRQRALLQNNNTLHDILYDYLHSIVGVDERRNLHSILVNAYGGPGVWQAFPDGPEDDEFDEFYAWRRIGYHLSRSERLPELRELLTNGDFLKAKIKLLGVADSRFSD